MWWELLIAFVVGVLFTLAVLSGCFWYTWRHKEKYMASLSHYMMRRIK